MKRTVLLSACIILSFVRLPAQVTFSPASLTWAADDTEIKVVNLSTQGYWETDSTTIESHFMLSRYNGHGPCEIEIVPVGVNTGGGAIIESLAFRQGGVTSYLELTHQDEGASLYVNPSSLIWPASDTGSKNVSISCQGSWTASCSSSCFVFWPSSGTGNATISVQPSSVNATALEKRALLSVTVDSMTRTTSLEQSGVCGPPGVLSVSPSSLFWDYTESGTQYVRVISDGRWESDSTHLSSHFIRGEYNGYDSTLFGITPSSDNPTGCAVEEQVKIWNSRGDTVSLFLRHISVKDKLKVSPLSYSWTAADTTARNVFITTGGAWTATIRGNGFKSWTESGTGDAVISVSPSGTNGKREALEAILEISGEGLVSCAVFLSQAGDGSACPALGTEAVPDGAPGQSIPFSRSVTPSGAVTYSIPIMTDCLSKFAPTLAISYNSQSGNGVAGYGWNITGFPSITQIPRTIHYHGEMAAAHVSSGDRSYALDGIPFVASEGRSDGSTSCQYETVRGHIRVKEETYGFKAFYPDGSRASFGVNAPYSDVFFPVTDMTDRFGNRIEISYISDGGCHYPQTVTYNIPGDVHGQIDFVYEDRTDFVDMYYAGIPVSQRKLLARIVSSVGGTELRTYTLQHDFRGDVAVLAAIHCSVGESHMAPLRFEYGNDGPEPEECFTEDVPTVVAGAVPTSPNGDVLLRGKFSAMYYEDGVAFVPEYPNYERKEYNANGVGGYNFAQCSSAFPEDAVMHIIPIISMADTLVLPLGSNFQDIQLVDTDNDGTDEIVKVNYGVTPFDNNQTRLYVSVYKYNESTGKLMQAGGGQATVTGSVIEEYDGRPYYSLRQRAYRYGCFTQDGSLQLLTVSYSRDMLGRAMPANTAIIDVLTGRLLYDDILLDVPFEEDHCLFVADMDSDGISEICLATSRGLKMYSYADGSINLDRICGDVTSSAISGGCSLTDFNGDGYVDIVCHSDVSPVWTAFFFNGRSFSRKMWDVGDVGRDSDVVFIDINKDGLPDAVCMDRTTGRISHCINRNGSLAAGLMYSGKTVPTGCSAVPVNLIGYNSASSFTLEKDGMLIPVFYSRDSRRSRLLTGVKDGMLNVNRYSYGYVSEPCFAYGNDPETLSDGDWYKERSLPLPVASESRTISSGITVEDRRFRYFDATVGTDGTGFLCFASIQTTDVINNRCSVQQFAPSVMGSPFKVHEYLGSIGGPSISDGEDVIVPVCNSFGKPVDTRLMTSSYHDNLTGICEGRSFGYDSLGYVTSSVSVRQTGYGVPVTDTSAFVYDHRLADDMYVLGSVSEEIRYTDLDGDIDVMSGSRTEVTFDSDMRPVRTRSYCGALTCGVPQWTIASDRILSYDGHGNVTCDRTAERGSSVYNTTLYTYDAEGRCLTSSTDVLGRTNTYLSHDIYGNPALTRDWLNRSTSFSYDEWGNLLQTTRPDGGVETNTATWCGSADPGVMCVTKTVSGQPDTKTWYDAFGREVRSAFKRFDGGWQYADTRYDSRGRLFRTSAPYKDLDTGPTMWSTCTYDAYDRLSSFTDPNGGQTTWNYNGTTTTTVKECLESASTEDAAGNVITVNDCGGTVSYTLRDDGTPSRITVMSDGTEQETVTTFLYDIFGRRTSMTDPSAGTRTDIYVDNPDGTGSVAHTGPNGTVTTYYDRFGRVAGVSRPEFDTEYTYGTTLQSSSYGKLMSVISTNGSGESFTYDSLGRILTETCYADCTHWLRKSYTYGVGSNVSSVVYSTQDGNVATEAFNYANGHNTGAYIPGNTDFTIWQLADRNALGLPTRMITGTASRTYSYTSSGIPGGRVVRNAAGIAVQDLSYGYDSSSGNMLMRRDNVSGYIESFVYDSMNRLYSTQQSITGNDCPLDYCYEHVNMDYDSRGNVIYRDNDGILECNMTYTDMTDPYKVTGNHSVGDCIDYTPEYGSLPMTSFDRPAGIGGADGIPSTLFTYDAGGSRVKMSRNEPGYGIHMDRYYLGGVYEMDHWLDGSTDDTERLFLGGSAYDAPMVLVKTAAVNGGVWTPFNILRDVQGSITDVTTADGGTVVESFRYDPWGLALRMDDVPVDSLMIGIPDADLPSVDSTVALPAWKYAGQSVYVGGHGYTGHEHLPGWGLVNMNARLYDPAIGRFLSPDPLIQDPLCTRNFNRYSYCLNNPLKYTDESGEFWHIVIGAAVGGIINLAANLKQCNFFWEYVAAFGAGAGAGALTAATGGATSGWLATAGAGVVAATIGGASISATNDIIAQYTDNSSNESVQWRNVGLSAFAGGVSGILGSLAGEWASSKIGNVLINGIKIKCPVISSGLTSLAGGTVGGMIGGFSSCYLLTGDLGQAWKMSLNCAVSGGVIGGSIGAATGYFNIRGDVKRTRTSMPFNAEKESHYSVYLGFDPSTNEIKYVGMTGREVDVRFFEHFHSKTPRANLRFEPYVTGITKMEARILEQQLINQYGLLNLYNKINSIAPKYWAGLGILP